MTASQRELRRGRGDGGSVLPEFALALPLLALLVMGVLDYGFAWQEGNLLERAASNAARTGSSSGVALEADQDMVLSVGSSLANARNVELERLIIYNAQSADGELPASCDIAPSATAATGVNGLCNVYSQQQVESGTGFSWTATGCNGGSWDFNWCPADRETSRSDPDYIGVYIEATYTPITNIVPGDITIERKAVYMIEPESASTGDDNA
jgi:Flp pilus assembly protein TadG